MTTFSTKKLGDLLSTEQITLIKKYFKTYDDRGSARFSNGLKELLAQWKEELLAKGINSDYLAYWLIYQFNMPEDKTCGRP